MFSCRPNLGEGSPCTYLSHIANVSGDGENVGGDGGSSGSNRSRVLELLERNRKVARSDGLYQFVLWREALRGTAAAGGCSMDNNEGEEEEAAT